MATTGTPLYLNAILLPLFAFPSWILCLLPLSWHFRQGNVAAGSLILWVIMVNFCNSINPLIWPRDNTTEWWNGNVWCDINVRLQVGCIVGTTASAAMIVRKLARVMDTRNITVSSSRDSKFKERGLEILWCWIYPLVLILLYYIVQPVRYMIYGIIGCLSAYDSSWPSMVLISIWAPITTLVATGYSIILSYRLYRYRREFVRLVATRNTTKSRFIRLFIICIIIVLAYTPYTIWLIISLSRQITDTYSWSRVHDPATFHSVFKAPSFGIVTVDKWGQVATGYVLFFVFGTGSDAYNTYKKMMVACGLGRVWPSLYVLRESGASTPNSFINARTWTSGVTSKAMNLFKSRSDSVAETWGDSTRNNSLALGSMKRLGSVATVGQTVQRPSFLGMVFGRKREQASVLPVFSLPQSRSLEDVVVFDMQNPRTYDHQSSGLSTHAWAADKGTTTPVIQTGGLRVFSEARQECQELDGISKERRSDDAWA
ncbi:hypothetical protein HBI62_185620 [Parastagonospora nodorum]|nr:hypothetical protein HBH47_050600 [Parastagonospora nodorum]KAH4211107.1 hypothetical protein HBI95_051940 [Parastagonospora nodorum]KAH4938758.1 hypothetical protein HBI79_058200 [Parastagonospora nodorum]KAH5214560.1 hypothetical protein HBI62_185620 [Parastagonospora nodorum]KAH6145881.1 hypothetical protein HBI63_169830 [Parastagonospora nodorum]